MSMWQTAYIVGKSNIKILNKMLIYLNFSGHLSTYLYNKKAYGTFFFHVSTEWSIKFRHISILFNILILDMPTMQSICHVDIFH